MDYRWLDREISTGVQKLLCLGLEGQPAAEVIEGTVSAWLDVLTNGREYVEQRDAERFRTAFRTLMATCTRWPQPRHLLDVLPPPPPLVAIGRDPHYDPRVAADNLRKLEALLKGVADNAKPDYGEGAA